MTSTLVCLKKLAKCSSLEAAGREMHTQALARFSMPGEANFPLNAYFERMSSAQTEELRKYLIHLRHEVGFRLAERVFDPKLTEEGRPSKWWICFSRRKFLNKELNA